MNVRQHFLFRHYKLTSVVVLSLIAWGSFRVFQAIQRPRWNVLFITLDTTRSDRIGCYGYQPGVTPVLDGLAQRGVLFERAYTSAPLTLSAHASMFTGLYPPEHGIRTNGKSRLNDELPTLAESFLARGYATGAFIASFVLDSKFGLDRGFQLYDDDLTGTAPADEALHRNREGIVVVDRALEWLAGQVHRPFFCWIHLYDPHSPYLDHQDQFGKRFIDRPYDAEIAYVDVQVGRLLAFVKQHGLDDRTLIVVVGDHGEGLDEHQERRHGQMLYNSTLQVPWIMALPGTIPEGRRIDVPVSVADVYPTLIEGAYLQGASRTSGRSVMPLVRGQKLADRSLYAETNEPLLESGWSPLRSLIHGQWKYIRTPREELYDLVSDPGETRNLATELKPQTQSLEQQLTELERGLKLHHGNSVKLSAAELRKLASLGYAGHTGSADELVVDPKLHDIKEMIAHYNTLEDARLLLDAGMFDQAEQRLMKLVAAAPDLEFAELSLGDVQFRRGKLKEAQVVYEGILKRNPECALAYLHLGDIREAQGQFEPALAHYQEALEREPDSAKLHYNIGRLQVILGREDEAVSHFEEALQLDPGYVFAHIELGSALGRRGFTNSALAEYELALKYDSRSFHAHLSAASLLDQLGRPAEVAQHLEKAVAIKPDQFEAQLRLGELLVQQGTPNKALPHLQAAERLQPQDPRARELLKTIRESRK